MGLCWFSIGNHCTSGTTQRPMTKRMKHMLGKISQQYQIMKSWEGWDLHSLAGAAYSLPCFAGAPKKCLIPLGTPTAGCAAAATHDDDAPLALLRGHAHMPSYIIAQSWRENETGHAKLTQFDCRTFTIVGHEPPSTTLLTLPHSQLGVNSKTFRIM